MQKNPDWNGLLPQFRAFMSYAARFARFFRMKMKQKLLKQTWNVSKRHRKVTVLFPALTRCGRTTWEMFWRENYRTSSQSFCVASRRFECTGAWKRAGNNKWRFFVFDPSEPFIEAIHIVFFCVVYYQPCDGFSCDANCKFVQSVYVFFEV